jgi:hypothetical protein
MERGKGFPRLSLSGAVQIIETASKFGKSWPKEQFAGFGSKIGAGSAKSGAFAARISSLRDYGLIVSDKETVSLTELGLKITKPVTEAERRDAIKTAFLSVNTFKVLFDSFEGGVFLPKDQVAQHAVYNIGISRESKDKFINTFIDSGRFVGLVDYNKEELTIKLLKDMPNRTDPDDAAQTKEITSEITPSAAGSAVTSAVTSVVDGTEKSFTEQGVNYSGNGWSLTVLLKSSRRLDPTTRKKVRDLLETADELSDLLHETDSEG